MATPVFLQATMSLIQFGEYVSWKLPEKCHLILTSNPDNSEYSVSALDPAQMSRLINFSLDFDYEQYGRWMDKNELNTQSINFMLMHPEIFDQSTRINARTYTMFANALKGIKDFSSPTSLEMISCIARGCFGEETTIGDLFVTFVNNKLDKLISAKEMLSGKWEDTKKKIKDNVMKDGEYRADIASVLTMRLINYIELLPKVDSKTATDIVDRVNDIVCCDETLLTEDLIFNLIASMNKDPKFNKKCIKLLMNPKVQNKILA